MLMLDEPVTGLDIVSARTIAEIIHEQPERGVSVVYTTHDLDEAERSADHVVIIDRGAVVAAGAPSELVRPTDADQILFGAPADLPVDELAARLGAAVARVTHGEYRVALAPTPANVAALTSWLAERDLPLEDLRAGRQRLDDVFRRLTTHDEPVAAPATGRSRARRGRRRR